MSLLTVFFFSKMAAYTALQTTQKHFDLFFSNAKEEDQLDDGISCASEFQVDCTINLRPLTFMRSTNTECALKIFHADSSPLTICAGETIEVFFKSPTDLLTSNKHFYSTKIEKLNSTPFLITTSDFSATSNKHDVLDYINHLLGCQANFYFMWRLSLISFDLDIFNEGMFGQSPFQRVYQLTLGDIELISAYTTIAIYTRIQFLKILAEHVPGIDLPTVSFPGSYTPLTRERERELIDESLSLKPSVSRDREVSEMATKPLVDFAIFNAVDLSRGSRKRNALDTVIRTRYVSDLSLMQMDLAHLSAEDKELMSQFQRSHIALIKQAECIHLLLALEHARLTQPAKLLIQHNFLTLKLSVTRTQFVINNRILPRDETAVKIVFPPNTSYVLGTRSREEPVIIDNISHSTETGSTRTMFTLSSVTNDGHRLYTPIKSFPSLVHICTDILSDSSIFKSMKTNTLFSHFNVLHTEKISEDNLVTNSVYKPPDELSFHRILRSFNQLNRVKILLLDGYFQKVYFPLKTQVYASIRIQSTAADD